MSEINKTNVSTASVADVAQILGVEKELTMQDSILDNKGVSNSPQDGLPVSEREKNVKENVKNPLSEQIRVWVAEHHRMVFL